MSRPRNCPTCHLADTPFVPAHPLLVPTAHQSSEGFFVPPCQTPTWRAAVSYLHTLYLSLYLIQPVSLSFFFDRFLLFLKLAPIPVACGIYIRPTFPCSCSILAVLTQTQAHCVSPSDSSSAIHYFRRLFTRLPVSIVALCISCCCHRRRHHRLIPLRSIMSVMSESWSFRMTLPLLALLLSVLFTSSSSHSWCSDPPTYNRVYLTKHCRGQCNMVCPHKEFGRQANSESRPTRTYRRGQLASFQWVQNNHRGGITRLALVPVKSMWSREAHKKLSFYYTCWDSHHVRCPNREMCGTDTKRQSMRAKVRIPTCLPDGNYVFGYVWYGGLHWSRRRGLFADYYHCSHVVIKGGAPLKGPCKKKFEPGRGPSSRGGKCQTASDEPVGRCKRDNVCRGRSFFSVPRPFKYGRQPSFTVADVLKYMGKSSIPRGKDKRRR